MKTKTSELTGPALDWAVAKCEAYPVKLSKTGFLIFTDPLIQCGPRGTRYSPSTNWSQGGPILERERVGFELSTSRVEAYLLVRKNRKLTKGFVHYGPTHLVAAMRCYCCSKLGDVVDVPEELCQQQNS